MKKLFLISILSLLLSQLMYGQNPFITNYTIADGLPTNRCNCVLQDNQGFLWFGTDAGAIRYDGNNFLHFTTKDGLSYNTIVRMKQDMEGRIWFLNSDGSVNFYKNHRIYNESNAPFLGEIKTDFYYHNFYQDKDSAIYLYNGAAEVSVVKKEKYIDCSISEDAPVIFNISSKANGNLLYWEPDKIVEKSSVDKISKIHETDIQINRSITAEDGITYVADQLGNIHLFRESTLIKRNFIHLETKLINDILVDDEFLWISTFDKGLFCFSKDSLIFHESIDKLQNLIHDDQNNIWTCSNTYGIFKINTDILKYKTIGIEHFHNQGIRDIESSNMDGLWITNGESIYLFQDGEVFNRYIKTEGNIFDNIYQLKNNAILISGANTFLNILEDVEVNKKRPSIDYGKLIRITYNIKKFVVDSTESILYSYLNNNLIITNINNQYRTHTSTYQRWGRIRNLFFNYKQQLVVNGEFNAVIYDGMVHTESIYSQFNGKRIVSNVSVNNTNEILLIEDRENTELVLINNDNVFRLFQNLSDYIDLKIRDMIYYKNTLFLYTFKTVYFISNPNDILNGEAANLNRLNFEFNNVNDLFCQDDNLYVATDDGLTIIPFEECVNSEPIPTIPYFSNVLLDDQEIDLTQGNIAFKNKDRLRIEFSSLNFSSVPSTYAYMLEGVNDDWIIGNERQITYFNLKPGHYTFKLKSRKNLESYSEVIELPIEVIPTFFQLLITRIIIVLIVLFLIFLIVRAYFKRQIISKEKDNQLVTLENRALQSMMNPHFIFNSLGSIQKYLLQNKAEEAGKYLSQFARLIRQTMQSIKSNYVLLDDEVDRLRNYVELEQIRMGNRFEYSTEMDNKLQEDEYNIPSMIVQPFVENAIWHGISQLKGNGKISVCFKYINEKSILIVIEDNGIGFEKSKAFSKSKNNLNMASNLTSKRIQLLGDKYKVRTKIVIEELHPGEENPGSKVKLVVPIIYY